MRRSAPLCALLALLSLSVAHAAVARPAPSRVTTAVRQAATCATGKRSGPFCCAAACARCGGSGCGAGGNAASCCTGRISSSGRVCGRDAPPCKIVRTAATQPPVVTAPAPADPTCATGVRNGEVCCPASCGTCGGSGCGSRGPGGSQCCYGTTQRAGILCSNAGPPCLVRSAPATQPPPTTAAPTTAAPTTAAPTTAAPTTTQTSGMTGPVGQPGAWVNIDDQLVGRPQARHEACFLMVNGKGYLLGGRGNRVVSILDPVKKTWSAGPAMVRMIHHMQCVSRGSKIYIAAGWEGRYPVETNLERMHIFDTATLQWSTADAIPAARRRGAAAVIMDAPRDRMYVVAGNTGGHGPPSIAVNWFDYYDFKTGAWVTGTLPDIPGAPRDHVLGDLLKGEVCVAGGRDGSKQFFFGATVAMSYCYNFGTGAWREVGEIPTQRGGASTATTCADQLMVAGGEGARFAHRETELNDGSGWTVGPKMVGPRHGTGLAVSQCGCGHIFTASGSARRGGRPEVTTTELYVPPGGATTCSSY